MKERPNEIDRLIGERLQNRRRAMKVSQKQLGFENGLCWQAISRYERGAVRIPAARLVIFGHQLGASPDYFFQGIEVTAKRLVDA